jgi:uncharacterized protein YecE (DUF72 family)
MVFIGTAGWSVPRASARHFPSDGSHLERYALRLNCAEVNSSFYRAHASSTYERWAAAVPPAFRFSVKIPRAITHDARLRRVRGSLQQFLDELKGLGKHLGPLLVQLPPSFAFDAKAAKRFFALLRALHSGPVVIEPRHITWFTSRVHQLLEIYRISRVAADPALIADAEVPGGAHDELQYYRLHGSPRMYWSTYSCTYLRGLAEKVAGTRATTWVIFDNTASGSAVANALQLQNLLPKRRSAQRSARAKGGIDRLTCHVDNGDQAARSLAGGVLCADEAAASVAARRLALIVS